MITAGGVISYIVMCVNYLCFYRALHAQGIDRSTLVYRGWFQPYGTWFALCFLTCIVTCYGYSVLTPGNFKVGTFFSYYTMVFSAILTFTGWKVIKGTKFVRASEADLIWDRPEIDLYEELNWDEHTSFTTSCLQLVRRTVQRKIPAR